MHMHAMRHCVFLDSLKANKLPRIRCVNLMFSGPNTSAGSWGSLLAQFTVHLIVVSVAPSSFTLTGWGWL